MKWMEGKEQLSISFGHRLQQKPRLPLWRKDEKATVLRCENRLFLLGKGSMEGTWRSIMNPELCALTSSVFCLLWFPSCLPLGHKPEWGQDFCASHLCSFDHRHLQIPERGNDCERSKCQMTTLSVVTPKALAALWWSWNYQGNAILEPTVMAFPLTCQKLGISCGCDK